VNSVLLRLASRVCAALSAGLLAAMLTGALFAARAPAMRGALAWRLAALLSVPGLFVGVGLAALALFASTERVARVNQWLLSEARAVGSLLVVLPPACAVWVGLAALAGRHFMTSYHHVGLATFAQSVALLALTLASSATAFVAARALGRRLPSQPTSLARAVALPAAVGLALAAAIVGHGVFHGDEQGRGRALALFMGAYGVLKKPELDLAPVAMLAAMGALGTLLAVALRRVGLVALPVALVAAALLLGRASREFADSPVASEIDARPGLPRVVLRALRKRNDRDRDGFAGAYGGGDCDDRDARRNPGAADVAGNGVDEDCSGADARRVVLTHAQPAAAQPAPARTPEGMNLLLITVDTMRWDLHFAGYAHPITPRLDALAAESVVFERGYAISSYTGRAIGPMMTGRYPTECARDGEHFTRYTPPNVFLAERLKDSGFRTFGAASHFYFERRFGLAQGVDAWDLTAKPEGDGQETTSADAAVADRAIAQLQQPENAAGRFFQWVHFFDPHKQYVEHRDLPLFARGERGRYDREVMNTDRQICRVLDALRALPGDVARRTVVVVTADHGEAFNEHGMSYHGVEVWDELVRVPWVMHVPGVAARRVTTPRGQIDLAPTLLELLRVAPPAAGAPDAFSGQSLMGDLTAEQPERPIYVELPEGPYNSLRRALVFEGYKLLERGSGRFMLFNLATDAGERNDLAAVDRERLARMRAVMEEVRGGLHVVAAPPPRDRE
jgi:arylsulfatase A-like enzyme